MAYWVYILWCADHTLYTGTAADVDRRAAVHNRGKGAKYTRSRLPVEVVYREPCPDKGAALRREYAIKQLSRRDKLALISYYQGKLGSTMKKAAFIGAGNMGGALIQAACQAIGPEQVIVSNRSAERAQTLAAACGCAVAADNAAAAREAAYVFLCVKPQVMEGVVKELVPVLRDRPDTVLISIAAGIQISTLQGWLRELPFSPVILRILPNTPASIGMGMLALTGGSEVQEDHYQAVEAILAKAGRVERLTETQIDAFSAVAGCGPAFVYPFIEALADGGVKVGLPRQQAMVYAAQMVLGSAALVLESGKHPGQLKDEVCSPGGSTIAGVAALEARAFRSAVIEAVEAAYRRTVELGKV